MLSRLSEVDLAGLIFMIIAGFTGYAANFIVLKILGIPRSRAFKYVVIIKVLALFIAIAGVLKITGIL